MRHLDKANFWQLMDFNFYSIASAILYLCPKVQDNFNVNYCLMSAIVIYV